MFWKRPTDPVTPPHGTAGAGAIRPLRPKPQRGLGGALFKGAAVVLGALIGAAVFRLPVFAVSDVEVVGVRHLSEADILERAALHGQNLLALSIEELEAVFTREPWVRRVDIQRQLPGKITIYVEERRPAAVWEAAKRQFLVDAEGAVLEEVRTPTLLPVIRDLDGAVPTPGEKKDGDAIALALTLTEVLPRELGQNAKHFEYLSYGGLVVETDKGRRARFGDSSDLQWKLAVWKALLQEGATQNLKVGHVDLRFGDRPFFRP